MTWPSTWPLLQGVVTAASTAGTSRRAAPQRPECDDAARLSAVQPPVQGRRAPHPRARDRAVPVSGGSSGTPASATASAYPGAADRQGIDHLRLTHGELRSRLRQQRGRDRSGRPAARWRPDAAVLPTSRSCSRFGVGTSAGHDADSAAPTAAWKSRPDREIPTPAHRPHRVADLRTNPKDSVDRSFRFLRFPQGQRQRYTNRETALMLPTVSPIAEDGPHPDHRS